MIWWFEMPREATIGKKTAEGGNTFRSLHLQSGRDRQDDRVCISSGGLGLICAKGDITLN